MNVLKPRQAAPALEVDTLNGAMPFARPHFREIIGGLRFAIDKDYPARGELS